MQMRATAGALIEHAEFGSHGIAKFPACLTLDLVRSNEKSVTCLAALISHNARQFLAVYFGACLFTPAVSERSSRQTNNARKSDTAECPGQGEPSTPVCHAHLTNIELVARPWAV
jgi:hypothetical protein